MQRTTRAATVAAMVTLGWSLGGCATTETAEPVESDPVEPVEVEVEAEAEAEAEAMTFTDLADPTVVETTGRPVMTLEIPAQREDGVALGTLPAGTTIYLQYAGGEWKAWGALATENPDAEELERPDESRLVLADYADPRRLSEVRTIVPPNTAEEAFAYTLEQPADNLVLRIHNGNRSSFRDNPGSVRYRVLVLMP